MRKNSPVLSALLDETKQNVLAELLLHPEREIYLSQLARTLKTRASTLQRPLAEFTLAGILIRRTDGNRTYFRADPSCPILKELIQIIAKTIGIAEPLRECLIQFKRQIEIAFIHGSVAESREKNSSDIDLIIVGEVSGVDLSNALVSVGSDLQRPINTTTYTRNEFSAKTNSKSHFVTSILNKPKIFLIGDEHELDKIIGRGSTSAGKNQQV